MPSWHVQPQILLFHVAWLDSKNDFHGTKVKRIFRMAACPADDTGESINRILNLTLFSYSNRTDSRIR
jgi:hypothetical protein